MSRRKPGGYSNGALQTTRYVFDIVVDGVTVKTWTGCGARDSARVYLSDYGPTAIVKRRTVPIDFRSARQRRMAGT